jgi:hypothetical protein
MQIITLTAGEWREVNEHLAGGFNNKIPAIKVVRTAERHRIPGVVNPTTGVAPIVSGVGLREAKEAIEVLMAERGMKHTDGSPCLAPAAPAARLGPFQPIRRIVCNFGEGEVELDMDAMSLRVLTGLNGSMRIQDALALVDLYKRVKDWEEELMQGCKPPGSVV